MKDIPSVWTVNNGFAVSKMLLTYYFEVLSDFKGFFLEHTHLPKIQEIRNKALKRCGYLHWDKV